MTKRAVLSLGVAAALAVQGCGSDTSDPAPPTGPLEPLRTLSIAYNLLAVGGHGPIVAMLDYNGDNRFPGASPYQLVLRIAERAPAEPAELLDRATLPLDASAYSVTGVLVTEDWVTVCADAKISVVSLAGPSPALTVTVDASPGAQAIASGSWLLEVDGTALRVRDLGSPGTAPQVGSSFDTGATVTGLAVGLDGFYAFTSGGIVHVSMQGGVPTFGSLPSPDLRLFSKAYLHGGKLYAGGPSPYLGKARIARIDVSTYAAPTLEESVDVEGVLEDFAYDGAGAYVALAQTPDWATQRVVVAREMEGAIVPGIGRELPNVLRGAAGIAHASGGLLYAAYMSSPHSPIADSLAIVELP